MKAFKVFIFGLLYGWFMKVAYDRIYHRNEMEDIRNENQSLKEYIRNLEAQLQAKSLESKSVTRAATQQEPVSTGIHKDDLKVIRGIGPAIEKRLNNAGIFTFEALARLSVQELETILGNARRLAQEGDLIAQARELAGQSK